VAIEWTNLASSSPDTMLLTGTLLLHP